MGRQRFLSYGALMLLFSVPAYGGEPLFDRQAGEEHFRRGFTFYLHGNYKSAVPEFEDSIRNDPDLAKAYYFLGYTYYRLGRMGEANQAFLQAYEVDPRFSPRPLEQVNPDRDQIPPAAE